jgi:dihydrofolate reductase
MEKHIEGSRSMRRLIVWNVVTLDGFFEGPKSWDLDWHGYVLGEEFQQFGNDQLASADLLLFGRVTYQGMASWWPNAQGETADVMNGISKIVFSSTLEHADWNNTRLVREHAMEEVARLKQQPGKDILVFGSAELCAALLQHDLIDEYRLCVAPVVLGGGNPLFKPSPDRMKMHLLDARPLRSGGVILCYQPEVSTNR